jgi:carbon storage regulator CsrA
MLALLVLSRRINESIVFPSLGITIKVILLKGGAVRLGIEAPQDVAVLREELLANGCSPRPPTE